MENPIRTLGSLQIPTASALGEDYDKKVVEKTYMRAVVGWNILLISAKVMDRYRQ